MTQRAYVHTSSVSGVRSGQPAAHFRCPDFEAPKRIGAKHIADRNIGRIATPPDQRSANTRHIIPSIKNVPMTAQVCLEPGGEIHRAVWREYTDVAQLSCAVACWNVQAAAECDCEARVITTDVGPFIESLPGRFRGAGVLVTTDDILMPVFGGQSPRTQSYGVPGAQPCAWARFEMWFRDLGLCNKGARGVTERTRAMSWSHR